MTTAEQLAQFLLQIKAIQLSVQKPFIWASGWHSPVYCDNRQILSYPEIRTFVRDRLTEEELLAFGYTLLGAGYHVPITDNADFYGMFSFVSAEASIDGFDSVDEDGYAATIGLRGMIGERFELNGSLAYVDLGNGGDSTSFGAGALYNFSDAFAAGFSVGIDDDVTTYGIGLRVYFDR